MPDWYGMPDSPQSTGDPAPRRERLEWRDYILPISLALAPGSRTEPEMNKDHWWSYAFRDWVFWMLVLLFGGAFVLAAGSAWNDMKVFNAMNPAQHLDAARSDLA